MFDLNRAGSGPLHLKRVRRWVVLLLAIHSALLVVSAFEHSPTFDEPAQLVSGISHWKFGHFQLYRVNPPLIRMCAALPVIVFADPVYDWSHFSPRLGERPEFIIGSDFCIANGPVVCKWISWARLTCIPFSVFGAWICYHWATELFGSRAGLASLTLWCFSPSILGHGGLMTGDVPSAALSVGALYASCRWMNLPTAQRSVPAGVLLGAALLSKGTTLVLLAIIPALWVAHRAISVSVRTHVQHELWQLFAIIALGILLLNLAYGFSGSFQRLDAFEFESSALSGNPHGGRSGNRFRHTLIASVRLPFPRDYVQGIDDQREDFEDPAFKSFYWGGAYHNSALWRFLPYAMAVKLPLGTLGLVIVGTSIAACSKMSAWQWTPFAVAILLLLMVALQSGRGYLRYALPAFPFIFIWAASTFQQPAAGGKIVQRASAILVGWSVVSSLAVFPHNLSYFNEAAGGPLNGHAHLINNNIDWGQDLMRLREWMSEHPNARPMRIAYFGPCPPSAFCVEGELPLPMSEGDSTGRVPQAGWYAISVHILRGGAKPALAGGVPWIVAEDDYTKFQSLRPVATAGYSIYIFRILAETDDSSQ